MDLSIFNVFPNAIISGVWQLGKFQHGTVVGNQFEFVGSLDVIVDEGNSSSVNQTPEALRSDLLVYCMPDELPTFRTNALVSGYMLYNSEENTYWEIIDAGLGKNQETGMVEHVELKLLQTEIADVELS